MTDIIAEFPVKFRRFPHLQKKKLLCYNICVRFPGCVLGEEFGMYQIGDQVVYGIHGVCRVADQEERVVDRKRVTYLVLEPVSQDGSRYLVPAHNEAAMAKLRKMLTREELNGLLQSEEIHGDCWIRDENLRKQTYREKISGGDRASLMQMICTLYRHKEAQQAAGKKVHQCDENFLRDAEKLLAGEAAIVLDMEYPQALAYIREKLSA